MATEVLMPKLGATMESGTIIRWLKEQGDEVKAGEPLFEVMTDKVNIEVEAEVSGVLLEIACRAGEQVDVHRMIGRIGERGETSGPDNGVKKVRSTPAARRVAHDRGVQLSEVTGSGPKGRIQRDDVEEHAARAKKPMEMPVPDPSRTLKASNARKVIAQRMVQSAFSAPHVTLMSEVDMSAASALKEQIRTPIERETGARLSYTEIVLKAAARALREHAGVNASLRGDDIILHSDINIGLAVAVPDGLLVPVVRNADRKDLRDLTVECKQLTALARGGKLQPNQLTGSTFTISNLGGYAVDAFTPIINQPEAAILGVGRVAEKPIGVGGSIVLRPVVTLSLSFDHRVIDGAPAAAFLTDIKNLLEQPCRLLI